MLYLWAGCFMKISSALKNKCSRILICFVGKESLTQASDVKLKLRQMQEDSGRQTIQAQLTLFDSFQYGRENITDCWFLPLQRSVYIPSVQECPVLEVQWGHTHRSTFFQTIYSNPPEGGGSTIQNCKHIYIITCITYNTGTVLYYTLHLYLYRLIFNRVLVAILFW